MNYSERFQHCIAAVLKHEGGYVDDAFDAGGETNFGISKRAYPAIDIKNLTLDQAIAIYYRDYWQPVKGDLIVGNQLALQVFDMAVNAGVSTAAKILQNIVGVATDGAIGPVTLRAVDAYPSVDGLLWRYKFERARYYARLVSRQPTQTRFLMGWINRIDT